VCFCSPTFQAAATPCCPCAAGERGKAKWDTQVLVDIHGCFCTDTFNYARQGCVIRRIGVIRRIDITCILLYRTKRAVLYGCKICRFQAISAPKTAFQKASDAIIYWKGIGNILGDIGAIWVHFGSKTGTPKIASKYDRVIRIFCMQHVFNRNNRPN
jgi:hypothetical protein